MRRYAYSLISIAILGLGVAFTAGCAADAPGQEEEEAAAKVTADGFSGRYGTHEVLDDGGFVTLDLRADHTYSSLDQFGGPPDPFLHLTPDPIMTKDEGRWFLQSAGPDLVLKLTSSKAGSQPVSYVVTKSKITFVPKGEVDAITIKPQGSPFSPQTLMLLGDEGCIFETQCSTGQACTFSKDENGGPVWPGKCGGSSPSIIAECQAFGGDCSDPLLTDSVCCGGTKK
jgi:hypothetical protein